MTSTKMQQFRVCKGCAIHVQDPNNLRAPGTLVTGPMVLSRIQTEHLAGMTTGKGHSALEDAIRDGYIEPLGSVQHIDSELIAPGVRNPAPLKADNTDNRTSTPDSLTVQTSDGAVVESKSPAPAVAQPTPPSGNRWTFDANELAGKSLDDLNVLVLENMNDDERENFEGFGTTEDAIAFLTSEGTD